jgi:hypothetical protein
MTYLGGNNMRDGTSQFSRTLGAENVSHPPNLGGFCSGVERNNTGE